MKKFIVYSFMFGIICFCLSARAEQIQERETIAQISTLTALIEGIYDGPTTYAELKKWGDIGIGTFNQLDGEMIAVDGMNQKAAQNVFKAFNKRHQSGK